MGYIFRTPSLCVGIIKVAVHLICIYYFGDNLLQLKDQWTVDFIFAEGPNYIYSLICALIGLPLAIILLFSTTWGLDISKCRCRAKCWLVGEMLFIVVNIMFLGNITLPPIDPPAIYVYGGFHFSLIVIVYLYFCELGDEIVEGRTKLGVAALPENGDMDGYGGARKNNKEFQA